LELLFSPIKPKLNQNLKLWQRSNRVVKEKGKVTPLMKQYFQVKAKHPEAILLFRVGDFYETFGEDAITASRVLGIVQTNRNNGGSQVELAGFPHHSLDLYLPRLVKAGYRVAICEQLEKPSKEKKIVRRGVTEVVTPGVATDDKLLDHKANNFLAALVFGRKDHLGMALLDISTGEFLVCEGDSGYIDKLLQSFQPSEILYSKSRKKEFSERFGEKHYTFVLDEWVFATDFAREKLLAQFEVSSLKGFGIEDMEMGQIAAGSILYYLETTENTNLKHITGISRIQPDRYVWLDRFTIRNLELIFSQHDTGMALIDVLDRTISPMGARLLKKWVVLPLKSIPDIESRHLVVQYFLDEKALREEVIGYIRSMGDLERLISKVPLGKINPREVVQLRRALESIGPLKQVLLGTSQPQLAQLADGLNECVHLQQMIRDQIVEEPPVNLNKGGVIAEGFNGELDELRHIIQNSKQILLEIQQREAEATGIDKLKIGFNNVFGYYLEVTNKYKDKGLVPDHWTRKQTLTNSERYITDELKRLESKILGAEERILELEQHLFEGLVLGLAEYIQPVQHNASLIARLDCLISFSSVAEKYKYCRPQVDESLSIDITAGRHPVIEQRLDLGESYVPNDVFLDHDDQQIMMITGPNMSGKSALLRQTALICLMAQMGSFVPAKAARIGLVDKVFTRVGASDNISSGESTFMVEMNETASIMNNVSDRSLILLDEIGRGTSTYDGISIAWSIAEFLHNNGLFRPKTLFATHYHELNDLAKSFQRVKNYNVSVREVDNKVIFLRKLVPGGSEHSFGIHVAKMAGMPNWIVERANQILHELEQKSIGSTEVKGEGSGPDVKPVHAPDAAPSNLQLSIFETVDPTAGKIKEALQEMDLNVMTPIDCMLKLKELMEMLEKSE
jgi:DNA mismatch repair protein MutS